MIHRLIKREDRKNALVAIEKGGRSLVRAMPKPVELHQMRSAVRRSLILAIELLVGLAVVGAIFIGVVYQRLERGNIDLDFLVPRIEKAINDQLSDMSVRIESAFVGKNAAGRGVFFRLRNIVLNNKEGEVIANAPLAAVGLSLEALLWGRIAPSQMVFIEPSLELSYDDGGGLSLTYGTGPADPSGSGSGSDVFREIIAGMGQSASEDSENVPLWRVQRVDFMKAVTAAFEEARKRQHSSSYLSQFGVRDAVVRFRQDNRLFSWKVPDFVIDMRHDDDGSAIRGFGRLWVGDVQDQIPPWSLRFQTRQFDDSKDLRFDFGINDVTMQSLVRLVPALAHIQNADFPISGKLTATLGQRGDLRDSFANIQLSNGSPAVPNVNANGVGFDGSELKLAYSHKGRKLHVLPSPLKWGESHTMISGVIEPQAADGTATSWRFALKLDETRLAAPDFGLKAMVVEDAWATGSYTAEKDLLTIDALEMRAGNAVIRVNGSVDHASTEPAVLLNGQVSDVSLALLKRLWPEYVASDSRQWVGENMLEGRVASGRFSIDMSSDAIKGLSSGADLTPGMIDVDLQISDAVFTYDRDLLPVNVPEADLRISGRELSIDIPRGRVELKSGDRLQVSHGSFRIPDLRPDIPHADISFRVAGKSGAVLEFLNQPTLMYVEKAGFADASISGDVSGLVKLGMPLKDNLTLAETSLQGKFRLVQLKTGKLFGSAPVEGGTVDISLSEKGVGADGGVVIKGIPAKVHWQRIFGGKDGRQPPLRISAVLTGSERKAIGLTQSDRFISGDVPVVVTVDNSEGRSPLVQVRADLSGARIDFGAAQWQKPAGAAAVLQFNVAQQNGSDVELQHISLVAKEFFLEGAARLNGRTGSLEAFDFPNISYRLINTMSITGQRRNDGIMAIVAKIKSLDGRTVIRPLIISSPGEEVAGNVVTAFDHDLTADVDVIIGDQGASINGAHLEAKRRNGELEWLDFKGTMGERAPAAVRIEREEDGKRYLKAESYDAGSVFRLLGLYPNVEKGQLSLKVDLEANESRDKKGTLWVRNFAVIGTQFGEQDPVKLDPFKEGLAGSTRASGPTRRKAAKSRIAFDQLKAPFSYGNGRFELRDSFANGPAVGATLRGTVNFNEEKVKLTGTFVPLYGLNSAVGEIPLLNDLLIGRKGEGVFGVTFAIEGPTSQPVMVINPVSLLAPGVFRQIFDFANEQPSKGAGGSGKRPDKRRMQSTTVPVLQ